MPITRYHLFLVLTLTWLSCSAPWALRQGLQSGLYEREGAIFRSDTTAKRLYLMFTGHDYADGGDHIRQVLKKHHLLAYFFFTGDFIRRYPALVQALHRDGHYIGPHSDRHLLYCDWENRDSLLVDEKTFKADLKANQDALEVLNIVTTSRQRWFMPPYEWYNASIHTWANDLGWTLINFTPGTGTNADYTTPDSPNYRSTQTIVQQFWSYARESPHGLNGFHLLIHIGTDPRRTDKLYLQLDDLVHQLKNLGYQFK